LPLAEQRDEQMPHGEIQRMATYVLIHGAGDVSWYWHLVEAELRSRRHEVVAVDLPCADEDAGLGQYAETVVAAIGDRKDLIVVGQSFAGYTAPLVCAHLPVDLLVLVAAMIPSPGETAADMFANTGYQQEPQEDPSDISVFCHDLPRELAAEALAKGQGQAGKPFQEPWPLSAWPDVPTRVILARNDRLFPSAWLRKVAIDRLGIVPDEIASGHCVALSKPVELVEMLEAYRLMLHPAPLAVGVRGGT
jgi:pimeloyl-ACP methyl ester carboxylesterase